MNIHHKFKSPIQYDEEMYDSINRKILIGE